KKNSVNAISKRRKKKEWATFGKRNKDFGNKKPIKMHDGQKNESKYNE
ncbi:604_t:CDS:1, partial [Racocetra persica]